MAKAKRKAQSKAKRKGASGRRNRIRAQALGNVDGQYQFRFSGFARVGNGNQPWHLIGVGFMTLAGGNLSGRQWSTIMPMQGSSGAYDNVTDGWDLTGTYAVDNATNTLVVNVSFAQHGKAIEMTDVFRLVPSNAAGTAFWMISTNPQDTGHNHKDELVSGEAVKIA